MFGRIGIFLLCVIFSTTANAKLSFGTSDSLKVVSDVKLKGPNGEELQLSRKLVTEHFLLPYMLKDEGYVLTVKGKHDMYYNLPEEKDLNALQDAGFLPKPLPEYKMQTIDLVFGYAMWWALVLIIGWGVLKKTLRKRKIAEVVQE